MYGTISVKESGDLDDFKHHLARLAGARVLVGIPEKETSRRGQVVTNAGLMYIHTNGSQALHIPKRPVIEPALEAPDNQARIVDELGKAALAELDGKPDETMVHLQRAGTLGANAAKRWFKDPRNGWPQNSPRTIARKLSKLSPGKIRKDAFKTLDSVSQFMPQTGTTALDSINTPLIDTDEMRRAITHVEEI